MVSTENEADAGCTFVLDVVANDSGCVSADIPWPFSPEENLDRSFLLYMAYIQGKSDSPSHCNHGWGIDDDASPNPQLLDIN